MLSFKSESNAQHGPLNFMFATRFFNILKLQAYTKSKTLDISSYNSHFFFMR